jgi:hypothetical protein
LIRSGRLCKRWKERSNTVILSPPTPKSVHWISLCDSVNFRSFYFYFIFPISHSFLDQSPLLLDHLKAPGSLFSSIPTPSSLVHQITLYLHFSLYIFNFFLIYFGDLLSTLQPSSTHHPLAYSSSLPLQVNNLQALPSRCVPSFISSYLKSWHLQDFFKAPPSSCWIGFVVWYWFLFWLL